MQRLVHCAKTLTLLTALAAVVVAQDPAGLDVTDVSKWPMDKVTRNDGRFFAGMIRHEDPQQLELVEVGRRPGKPMYLLVRPLNISDIAKVERLSAADREVLKRRIDAFRNRTAILASMAADVRLVPGKLAGKESDARQLHYEGPWFTLDSTANDRITREAIVRIEQTFAGYRTLMRPRHDPPRPLGILLFGSVGQYQDYLANASLPIRNPAFFDPQRNLIVAGGDLASFVARLDETRTRHEELLKRLREKDGQVQQRLHDLSAALEKQGAPADKRRQVVAAARHQWQEQRLALEREIRAADQENAALYYHSFSRLYHEAFHAYLDNYVFDKQVYDVPRWLNEGWAQIFEAGQIDGNTLRLDAPRADLLNWLRDDLRSGAPLPLAQVIEAPPGAYLVGHQDAAHHASRLYRYCWGLAYDLTFRRQLLETPAMEEYLRRGAGGPGDPVKRFEKLVGKPLAAYEAEWRQAMLDLPPVTPREGDSQPAANGDSAARQP